MGDWYRDFEKRSCEHEARLVPLDRQYKRAARGAFALAVGSVLVPVAWLVFAGEGTYMGLILTVASLVVGGERNRLHRARSVELQGFIDYCRCVKADLGIE